MPGQCDRHRRDSHPASAPCHDPRRQISAERWAKKWYSGWRSRSVFALRKKRAHIVREKLNGAAGAVFEYECESACGANARDSRRRKTECNSRRQFRKLLIQMRLDGLELFGPGCPFVPRLESDDEESVVAGPNKTEQAETNDAGRVFHTRSVCQNVFDLGRSLRCSLQRRAVGQLQIHIRVTLVFIGKETRRHAIGEESSGNAKSQQKRNHHR